MGITYAQTLLTRTLGVVDRTITVAENFLSNLKKVNVSLEKLNLDYATRLANATLQISADTAEGTVAVKKKFTNTVQGVKGLSYSLKSLRNIINQKLGIKHSSPETEPEKTTQSQQSPKQTSISSVRGFGRGAAAGGGGDSVHQRPRNSNLINQLDADPSTTSVQNLRKLWEARIKK